MAVTPEIKTEVKVEPVKVNTAVAPKVNTEDNSTIKDSKFVHSVRKISPSTWIDSKGKAWAGREVRTYESITNIKQSRQWKNDLTKEEFLSSRLDLKWMIEHGEMEIITTDLALGPVESEYETI